MRKRKSKYRPELSSVVIYEARRIVAGHSSFSAAEFALQDAIERKDRTAERFWRDVFEGYCRLITRQGRGARSMDEWHNLQTANLYTVGFSPA